MDIGQGQRNGSAVQIRTAFTCEKLDVWVKIVTNLRMKAIWVYARSFANSRWYYFSGIQILVHVPFHFSHFRDEFIQFTNLQLYYLDDSGQFVFR